MFNITKITFLLLPRTNVLDMIDLSKGSVDMQKLLYEYRGVILVLLVLFIGFSLMSINVRMIENASDIKQATIYEK